MDAIPATLNALSLQSGAGRRRPGCDELAAFGRFRDIMRMADARENKMALVPSKFRDANPSGAKMLARVLVVIGVSRLG
jgi:hypothetical protein